MELIAFFPIGNAPLWLLAIGVILAMAAGAASGSIVKYIRGR